MIVYIAGPLTNADPAIVRANVNAAVDAAIVLVAAGHAPVVPHLFTLVDDRCADAHCGARIGYETIMAWDMALLARCDAVLCLGRSPGTDRELAEAVRLGIPCYDEVEEVPPCRP
jgi:hypothetical protein